MIAKQAPNLNANDNSEVFGKRKEHVSLKVQDQFSFLDPNGTFNFTVH